MATVTAIPTLDNLTYDELLTWLSDASDTSQLNAWLNEINTQGYAVSEMQAVEDYMSASGITFTKTAAGNYGITGYGDVIQVSTNTQLPNSNLATTARSKLQTMLNRGQTAAGKLNITTRPVGGGLGANAAYFVGSAASAVGAVSAGIALGKTIDNTLYNLNPNFWDSHGMSAINPETWNSITTGDGSWQAGLFNFIFGLDPTTGNAQAYMDANALALLAMYMKEMGVFATGGYDFPEYESSGQYTVTSFSDGVSLLNYACSYGRGFNLDANVRNTIEAYLNNNPGYVYISVTSATGQFSGSSPLSVTIIPMSPGPITLGYRYTSGGYSIRTSGGGGSGQPIDVNAVDVRVIDQYTSVNIFVGEYIATPDSGSDTKFSNIDVSYTSPIEGIGTQDGAVVPNVSGWNDIPSTLSSLQNQYPNMFTNPLVWDNVQPDGSNPQLTYVPIPWPNITGYNDTQPTSGISTQTNTLINDLVQPLVDTMMDLLRQTQTDPDTGTGGPPTDPVDTGTGGTPSADIPTGSASALWSVYHPSQGEVNAFGAWLWGSPFLTNIGKLFQNPIEGVVSLHKVFVTPTDSGTANIVVGTLDSGVSSATVNNQYEYVDCGSVFLGEDFANVFDYPPYTEVHLYLPFIGIVQLDTNDVMRATINVTYGVDVFTGACLAMVEVTRDGNTVNMYQYAGMCSVEYPLSSVQNSGLVSGLLAIAGGVAGIASGGATVPASLAIVGGAAGAAKSNIGRSGGFSGNAGAMGIKTPYLIIQRPQSRVAETFPQLAGYPTNESGVLSNFSGHVIVSHVHVDGIPATDTELQQIEALLHSGVLI